MENEDTRVYIEIPPSEVNYVNRIIEGYDIWVSSPPWMRSGPPARSIPPPIPGTSSLMY